MSQQARLAEGVWWVKDSAKTIVIDVMHQQAHLLQGMEMVLWDWLMLGYSFARIARMYAEAQDLPLEAAEKKLAALIQGWCEKDLLAITERADG